MKRLRSRVATASFAIGALSVGCLQPTQASLANGPESLDRVEAILSTATPEFLAQLPLAPMTCSSIEFTRSGGTGLVERMEMLPDPADPKNGIDDDADGLVDEVCLVWTDPSGSAQLLCSNVLAVSANEVLNGLDDNGNGLIDEGGVAFHGVSGHGVVAVGLTVPGPDGTPVAAWRNVEPAGR